MLKSFREFVASKYEKVMNFEQQLDELKKEMNERLDEVASEIKLASDRSLYNVRGPRSYNREFSTSLNLCRFWEIVIPSERNLAT